MGWKSTWRQILTGIVASMSTFLAGSSFVWVTPLLVRLQQKGAEVYLDHNQASWVVSLIEIGNLASPLPGAFLSDKVGRKPVLISVGPLYCVSWLLVLFTRSVEVLYAVRLIQGMALGIVYTVLPMYLGEVAEPKLRGALSTLFICFWFLGIVTVYAVGPFVSYQTLTWVCFVPTVVFTLVFAIFPESPHFYMMRGKDAKAAKSLAWLRAESDPSNVALELKDISNTIQEEAKTKANWLDVFRTKVGRKSLFLVLAIVMGQILGGFSVVLSYSTDTFKSLGLSLISPDMTTLIIGIATLTSTLISALFADRIGRKPILLVSAGGSALLLVLTTVSYFLMENYKSVPTPQWLPYASNILFMVICNIGLAALLPTLQAELFPNSTRGIASAIVSLSICILSFVVLKMYLPIQYSLGIYVNYVIYVVFATLVFIMILIFLPETKGKTFQEIQEILHK